MDLNYLQSEGDSLIYSYTIKAIHSCAQILSGQHRSYVTSIKLYSVS